MRHRSSHPDSSHDLVKRIWEKEGAGGLMGETGGRGARGERIRERGLEL